MSKYESWGESELIAELERRDILLGTGKILIFNNNTFTVLEKTFDDVQYQDYICQSAKGTTIKLREWNDGVVEHKL